MLKVIGNEALVGIRVCLIYSPVQDQMIHILKTLTCTKYYCTCTLSCIPGSSGSSANAEAVHGGFSSYSCYPYQENIHRCPLVLPYFHRPWFYVHELHKELSNQEVCTDQNLRVSCDHFCPEEGCQV